MYISNCATVGSPAINSVFLTTMVLHIEFSPGGGGTTEKGSTGRKDSSEGSQAIATINSVLILVDVCKLLRLLY